MNFYRIAALGVVVLFISFICLGVLRGIETHGEVLGSVSLAQLSRGSGVGGNFFLGIGDIGESQYYFYYYEAREGAYMIGKECLECGNIYIVEDATPKTARRDVIGKRFARDYIEFHVPPGSIIRGFQL